MSAAGEPALFSSSSAALGFALNHAKLGITPPTMNKAMAEVQPKPPRRRKTDAELPQKPEETAQRKAGPGLRGLEASAQAGMILLHLAKLKSSQRHALLCRTLRPVLLCDCKRPCCSGHKPNPDWVDSLLALCEEMKHEARMKTRGRKGFSTSPLMRRMLAEKYFRPERRIVLKELAQRCDVTEATVIAHKKPIDRFLFEAERDGWTALDKRLTKADIVGATEEIS